MKRSTCLFAISLLIIGLQACTNSAKKADDSVETAESRNDSIATVADEDAEFLVSAASGGMMEVELGKLAQTNGMNERVKNFGSMMLTDHNKANEKLQALAASKNVILPETLGKDHQKHVDRLKDEKGAGFDLNYMNLMVNDHKGDVKKFAKAAENAADPDVKAFAAEVLPVLQKHLDSAKAIHKMLKPDLENVVLP